MKESDEYWKWHGTPNCKCTVCGRSMYIRPNRLRRIKHGITCSRECASRNRSVWFRGKGNHQFGLKESLNASFKSWTRISRYGYILVHKKDHPFCSSDGMVFEHRLVVEENADLFNPKYFVEIDGKKYLKKEYDVHHKNEVKADNRVENLSVVTRAEHTRLHNLEREIVRNRKGQIVAFEKKGTPIPIGVKLFGNGKIPVRKTAGASCFDCYANEAVLIPKGTRAKVGLGFGLELPYCFEAVIRPRSGLSLKGIDCPVGTIDEDYKSEICAILVNNSGEDFAVNVGDRVCQIAVRKYEKFSFTAVDELSETQRGDGGFGSTGIK